MQSNSLFPWEWLTYYAEFQPHRIFLIYQDILKTEITLTYQTVAKRVDHLANYLAATYCPKSIIAICLPRGPEYIICMLATWKAGMIYMPFSDNLDNFNLEDIINQVNIATHALNTNFLMLTHNAELFSKSNFFTSERNKILSYENLSVMFSSNEYTDLTAVTVNKADSAYICCSSGTTGNPKLILNSFEGFQDRVSGLANQLMNDKHYNHCILDFSGFDFDASVMDILMALYKGASLYICPNYVKKNIYTELPQLFQASYKKNRPITVAVLLPSVLSGLNHKGLDPNQFPGLLSLVSMGDVCRDIWLKSWLDTSNVQVFNGYGPTEATIAATVALLNKSNSNIPLGSPLNGIVLYLVEQNDDPNQVVVKAIITPDTVKEQLINYSQQLDQLDCEIFLGGSGIGKYLHNEQDDKTAFLTPSSLTHWPFGENKRVYRTGDLACLQNGELIFKGRTDQLIKRNGQRVMLTEIKEKFQDINTLSRVEIAEYSDIRGKFVIAYVIPNIADLTIVTNQLYERRAKLEHRLKPDFFIAVSEIPLNQRFKYKVSSDLFKEKGTKLLCKASNKSYQSEWEKQIAIIWADLLFPEGLPIAEQAVDSDADFFELGGDSIDVSRLASRIWTELLHQDPNTGVPFDLLNYLYRNSKLKDMAAYLDTYYYQAAREFDRRDDYLPVFYLSNLGVPNNNLKDDNNGLQATIYQLVPKQLADTQLADIQLVSQQWSNMLEQCVRAILSKQQIGPYQLLATVHDELFARALASELAISGTKVYLTLHPSEPTSLYNALIPSLKAWSCGSAASNISIDDNNNIHLIAKLNRNLDNQLYQQVYYKLYKYYQQLSCDIILPENLIPLYARSNQQAGVDNVLNKLNQFTESNSQPVLFISGSAGAGKKTICQYFTFQQWEKYKLAYQQWEQALQSLITPIPILLDLQGQCSPHPLLTALQIIGLTEKDVNLLKSKPVIFVITGYDSLDRYDLPNIMRELTGWHNIKLVISLRNTLTNQYLNYTWEEKYYQCVEISELSVDTIPSRIAEFLKKLPNYPSLVPATLKIIEALVNQYNNYTSFDEFYSAFLMAWIQREMIRLKAFDNSSITINLSDLLESIALYPDTIFLYPIPSKWEYGFNPDAHVEYRKLINHPYFLFVKSLLIKQLDNTFILPEWLKKLANHYKIKKYSELELMDAEIKALQLNRPAHFATLLSPQELQNIIALYSSFVPINTGQHLTPIFFFHPLTGATPGEYRALVKCLGPKQPAYCFAMSENNESAVPDLNIKAKYFAKLIEQIQPGGDIYLVGWSYGAMLAYRVAAILEQHNRSIGLLFNIDCSSPNAMQEIHPVNRCLDMLKALPQVYTLTEEISLTAELKNAIILNPDLQILSKKTNLTFGESSKVIDILFNIAIEFYKKSQQKDYSQKVDKFLTGLKYSKINLKTCYQAFFDKIRLKNTTLHIAVPDHTPGVNPGPDRLADYLWSEVINNHEKRLVKKRFDGCDHYSIFKNTDFIKYFCELVISLQARLDPIPIEKKIANYLHDFRSQAIYITPEAVNSFDTTKRLRLDKQVSTFLDDKGYKTLLIQGDAGAGKTWFLKNLAHMYSNTFREANNQGWIPIYIKLHKDSQNFILDALKKLSFTEHEIFNDLKYRKILLLLDGFDETDSYINFYKTNNLQEWPYIKVIFTCRTFYLSNNNYKSYFEDEHHNLLEFYILPFSRRQIDDYLIAYQTNFPPKNYNMAQEFKKLVITHPELNALAATPLTLAMIAAILPELMHQAKTMTAKYYWTKTDLYQIFIKKIYSMAEQKLTEAEGISPAVNIKLAYQNYHQEIAFCLSKDKAIALDNHTFFNKQELDTRQVLGLGLLEANTDMVYFKHESYLDYFFASYLASKYTQDAKELFKACGVVLQLPLNPANENKLVFLAGILSNTYSEMASTLLKMISQSMRVSCIEIFGLNKLVLLMRFLNESKLLYSKDDIKQLCDKIYQFYTNLITSSKIPTYHFISYVKALRTCPYIIKSIDIISFLEKKISAIATENSVTAKNILQFVAYLGYSSPKIINSLCNLLQSDIPDLRKDSAYALGELAINNKLIIKCLTEAKQNKDYNRATYEEALWKLGYADTSYGKILDVFKYESPPDAIQKLVLQSLSMVDITLQELPQSMTNLLAPVFKLGFPWVTPKLVEIVKSYGDIENGIDKFIAQPQNDIPEITEPLIKTITHGTIDQKINAIDTCRELGLTSHAIVVAIMGAASNPDKAVRIQAIRTLSLLPYNPQVNSLLYNTIMHHDSFDDRHAALQAIISTGKNHQFIFNMLDEASINNKLKGKIGLIKHFLLHNEAAGLTLLCLGLKTDDNIACDSICRLLSNYNIAAYISLIGYFHLITYTNEHLSLLLNSTPLADLISHYFVSKKSELLYLILIYIISNRISINILGNSIFFYEKGEAVKIDLSKNKLLKFTYEIKGLYDLYINLPTLDNLYNDEEIGYFDSLPHHKQIKIKLEKTLLTNINTAMHLVSKYQPDNVEIFEIAFKNHQSFSLNKLKKLLAKYVINNTESYICKRLLVEYFSQLINKEFSKSWLHNYYKILLNLTNSQPASLINKTEVYNIEILTSNLLLYLSIIVDLVKNDANSLPEIPFDKTITLELIKIEFLICLEILLIHNNIEFIYNNTINNMSVRESLLTAQATNIIDKIKSLETGREYAFLSGYNIGESNKIHFIYVSFLRQKDDILIRIDDVETLSRIGTYVAKWSYSDLNAEKSNKYLEYILDIIHAKYLAKDIALGLIYSISSDNAASDLQHIFENSQQHNHKAITTACNYYLGLQFRTNKDYLVGYIDQPFYLWLLEQTKLYAKRELTTATEESLNEECSNKPANNITQEFKKTNLPASLLSHQNKIIIHYFNQDHFNSIEEYFKYAFVQYPLSLGISCEFAMYLLSQEKISTVIEYLNISINTKKESDRLNFKSIDSRYINIIFKDMALKNTKEFNIDSKAFAYFILAYCFRLVKDSKNMEKHLVKLSKLHDHSANKLFYLFCSKLVDSEISNIANSCAQLCNQFNINKVINYLKILLIAKPSNTDLCLLLGRFYYYKAKQLKDADKKQYDSYIKQAELLLTSVLDLNNFYPKINIIRLSCSHVYVHLGLFMFLTKRHSESIPYLQQSIFYKFDDQTIIFDKNEASFLGKEISSATKRFGFLKVKAYLLAYYLLVKTYKKLGLSNEATRTLEEFKFYTKKENNIYANELLKYAEQLMHDYTPFLNFLQESANLYLSKLAQNKINEDIVEQPLDSHTPNSLLTEPFSSTDDESISNVASEESAYALEATFNPSLSPNTQVVSEITDLELQKTAVSKAIDRYKNTKSSVSQQTINTMSTDEDVDYELETAIALSLQTNQNKLYNTILEPIKTDQTEILTNSLNFHNSETNDLKANNSAISENSTTNYHSIMQHHNTPVKHKNKKIVESNTTQTLFEPEDENSISKNIQARDTISTKALIARKQQHDKQASFDSNKANDGTEDNNEWQNYFKNAPCIII
jgi:acyl-coenzyme A synthetase/AMP-(fatty) acid ligase